MTEFSYNELLIQPAASTNPFLIWTFPEGVSSVIFQVIAAGGSAAKSATAAQGGGGGGAYAKRTLTGISPGTPYAIGVGTRGDVDFSMNGGNALVCKATNPNVSITNMSTPANPSDFDDGSSSYEAIAQAFTVQSSPLVLHAIDAKVYTTNGDANYVFYAELRLSTPTGGVVARSAALNNRYFRNNSTAGSDEKVRFLFGAIYLLPNTSYCVVIRRNNSSDDGIIFGGISTPGAGNRFNKTYAGSFVAQSGVDLCIDVITLPTSDIVVMAEGGKNASGTTGGSPGLAANSIGDVVFSGGAGANAQGGGGSRGGSGGGSSGTPTGAGAAGAAGSGASGGAGGEVITLNFSGDSAFKVYSGGPGSTANQFFGVGFASEGGGGGGTANDGSLNFSVPGQGIVNIIYPETRENSSKSMFAIFSPI